ncbi:MoaD/ThiS family protein [Tessaracoccus sp. SD287]|uniref:MoaD/ThiS family protein n=1 Tax=Tessaracoccus sp. SD287 TaxID=2782008 RepID=UPI001A96EB98|nr:MoaD/ThiS family protein [Tessaracoccus sp. SD287]MBO1030458.1 MoaD/ThiS family protein [Tessaracoccus sp. SD287]
MVNVRYFAAAADAAGTTAEQFEPGTLAEVLAVMTERHGERLAEVVGRCSLLLDGAKVSDPATVLTAGAKLDVLPPFAGG